MEIKHHSDGRWHFSLGPVERWIVGAGAFLIMVTSGLIFNYIVSTIQTTQRAVQQMVVGQALANQQLAIMNTQLAGVPSLQQQVVELKVEVTRNTSDISTNANDIRNVVTHGHQP